MNHILPASLAVNVFEALKASQCSDDDPTSPMRGLALKDARWMQSLAPQTHNFAAVMFGDLVGFTSLVGVVGSEELVLALDMMFSAVDDACSQLKV